LNIVAKLDRAVLGLLQEVLGDVEVGGIDRRAVDQRSVDADGHLHRLQALADSHCQANGGQNGQAQAQDAEEAPGRLRHAAALLASSSSIAAGMAS
jgi:hypothetical protein